MAKLTYVLLCMKDAALPIRSASFTVTRTGHCSFLFLLEWVNYRLQHQRTQNMEYFPFSLDHIRETVYPLCQKNLRREKVKVDKNWRSIKSYAPIHFISHEAVFKPVKPFHKDSEGYFSFFFREYETTGYLHKSELWMPILVCRRVLIVNLFTVLGDHWCSYMVCVCVTSSAKMNQEKRNKQNVEERRRKGAWATPNDEIRRARFPSDIVGTGDAVSHQIERGEGLYELILL